MRTILVVEDAPETLQAFVLLLQAEGFHVVGSSTGLDALRLMRQRRFDIMITDLNLPDIRGEALIGMVRAEARAPLAIATVTGENAMAQGRARQAGSDMVFAKPVEWSRVLHWLRSSTGEAAA